MTRKSNINRAATALILGTGVFALAACQEDRSDAVILSSQQDCVDRNGLGLSPAQCEAAFLAAQEEYRQTGPRYESRALCEEQHGLDACAAEEATGGGGGGSFMPFLAGYMVASMLNNNMASRALVATPAGGLSSTDGRMNMSAAQTQQRLSVANRTLTAMPAVTAGQPPMTRATVASRGGFGASSTAARGGSVGG